MLRYLNTKNYCLSYVVWVTLPNRPNLLKQVFLQGGNYQLIFYANPSRDSWGSEIYIKVKTELISHTGVVTLKFQVLLFLMFICPMSRIQSFFLYIYIYKFFFFCEYQLSARLDWAYCSSAFWVSQFFLFFFFFQHVWAVTK